MVASKVRQAMTKFFIKDRETDLGSSRCFIVTYDSPTTTVGQLIRDTQFSTLGEHGSIAQLAICMKDTERQYNFDYIVDPKMDTQTFDIRDFRITVSFIFHELKKERGYMLHCPTVTLEK